MANVILQSNTMQKDDDGKNQEETTSQFLHTIAITLSFILMFYAFSIGLTFYQRWFLTSYHIPLAAVSVHTLVKFIAALLCRSLYHLWKHDRKIILAWKDSAKFAMIGLPAGLDVALSQWGLSLITVSLYTMTKSTTIISVLAFALLLKLEKMSWSIVYIVGLISLGLFLFTYKSTQFQPHGFLLVLSASIFSGLRWTTTQYFVSLKSELNLRNPINLIYYVQPWMIFINAILASIFERKEIVRIWTPEHRLYVIFCTFTGATIAFLMEISEYLVIIHTSSLSLSVSGIVKDMLTLLIGYAWAIDEMSSINFLGLVILLSGILGHVMYKMSRMHDLHAVENTNDETELDYSEPQLFHSGRAAVLITYLQIRFN